MKLAVLLRCFAVLFLESARKIELIAESESLTYLKDGQIAFHEQLLSFEEYAVVNICAYGHSQLGFELFGKCAFGYKGVCRKLGNGYAQTEMGFDVIHRKHNAVGIVDGFQLYTVFVDKRHH